MEEGWIVELAAKRHDMVMVQVDAVYYSVKWEAMGGLGESFCMM